MDLLQSTLPTYLTLENIPTFLLIPPQESSFWYFFALERPVLGPPTS